MQESESLFDVVLDQIVEPMPRAPLPGVLESTNAAIAAQDDSRLGWTDGLIREHPPAVREILRRAGLSQKSELEPAEVTRAHEAVEMFADPQARAVSIREYIMPRPTDG